MGDFQDFVNRVRSIPGNARRYTNNAMSNVSPTWRPVVWALGQPPQIAGNLMALPTRLTDAVGLTAPTPPPPGPAQVAAAAPPDAQPLQVITNINTAVTTQILPNNDFRAFLNTATFGLSTGQPIIGPYVQIQGANQLPNDPIRTMAFNGIRPDGTPLTAADLGLIYNTVMQPTALGNPTGNCGEQACVTAFSILQAIQNNPQMANYKVRVVYAPGHAWVEIDTTGNGQPPFMVVDPWGASQPIAPNNSGAAHSTPWFGR